MLILGFVVALVCLLGCTSADTSVTLDEKAVPSQRTKVRAFYSGHSLTDEIPEAITAFAPSLAAKGKPADFDYDFQSGSGATIRMRSFGLDPSVRDGGYRFGRNRHGEGMDVAAEWREPRTLKNGDRYNLLVITERHTLPWTIEHEQTVPALAHYVDAFQRESPNGDVLLYHVWLALNVDQVRDWIAYERDALPLWECVASAINRELPDGRPKLRVLPGATALAELLESMMSGQAPIVTGSAEEKLGLLFSDNVHLAPAGIYFMALVHYAALFGVSPEGAVAPAGVAPQLAEHMQQLAWRHVSDYAKRAAAAASRDAAWCNDYADDVMCPRFYQYQKPVGGTLVERAKHMKNAVVCSGFATDIAPATTR